MEFATFLLQKLHEEVIELQKLGNSGGGGRGEGGQGSSSVVVADSHREEQEAWQEIGE